MDTKSVSRVSQCSNCQDKGIVFSVDNNVVRASICPSCNGHPPLETYPDGIDRYKLRKWFESGGFENSEFASEIVGKKLSSIILSNKEEILKILNLNNSIALQAEKYEDIVKLINQANFPSRYVIYFENNLKEILDKDVVESISEWLDSCQKHQQALTFYGPNGTGKTLAAILTALTFIRKHGKSVLFVSESDIFRIKKLITDTSIMERDKNHYLRAYENLRYSIESTDFLIIDDLGAQIYSANNINIYNDIIDMRYKSGKLNVFTTNHWKTPEQSLDRKTLSSKIGSRAADRVFQSEAVPMLGESKRQPLSVISREETENFSTLKCGVNGEVCFSFIARNPFFNIVSKHTRSRLTSKNGHDIDLIEPRIFNGTWHKDDKLTIFGPLLDVNNDQILYLALLDLLNKNHINNNTGIWLNTTFSEILDTIGIKSRDKNSIERVKISLMRLKRVSINFKSHDNRTWLGGFIENVVYEGKNKYHEIHILLNSNMIQFFKSHAFFNISLNLMRDMNDFAQVLYLFSESHKDDHKLLPLDIFSKLCGRETGSDKDFRKKTVEAVKTLINLDLYTDQSRVEKNTIHIYRKPKVTQLPQSSPPLQLS